MQKKQDNDLMIRNAQNIMEHCKEKLRQHYLEQPMIKQEVV
jgi:hypothetical protein